ncbi:MAG TPA: pyridoxamine 5'-phosphate oxidase [Solirubrobacteraceae bacterium]|nr:pyridoxamine 5'-phosphate oxidase [Solirubrobacteraceae bacterium]
MADIAPQLLEEEVDADPVRQFADWFAEEVYAGVRAPEAAALATASADGAPSVRMVLVKRYDDAGFVFFTNHESRKGVELDANPRAALLFHWDRLGRQVRIEGTVQPISPQETAQYVRSRPRGSQLSALASPQSRPIPDRHWLEHRVTEIAARHAERELPLPDVWGGFRLAPETFEFWQHRDDRLHDRLRYRPRDDGGWQVERLAP